MAVKTITIDVESYALLSRHKKAGQSFSQVIKEHFGRQPTVRDFLAGVRASHSSEDALREMELQVKTRQRHPARAVIR
ncbi:MAG: antitoxin VapB family protein [Vicinamibacterales bacterium]